jgi:hypothetical protein
VAFSPDGRLLASGSADRTACLHEAATGRQLAVFAGHSAPVTHVAFGLGGGMLVSGSEDRTLRLVEVEGALEAAQAEVDTSVSGGQAQPEWGRACRTCFVLCTEIFLGTCTCVWLGIPWVLVHIHVCYTSYHEGRLPLHTCVVNVHKRARPCGDYL